MVGIVLEEEAQLVLYTWMGKIQGKKNGNHWFSDANEWFKLSDNAVIKYYISVAMLCFDLYIEEHHIVSH